MLQLQGYNGDATYVPRANNPASYISRNPLTTIHADNPADHYIKHLIDYALLKSISLANIIQHFKQDPITQKKKKKKKKFSASKLVDCKKIYNGITNFRIKFHSKTISY